MVYGLVVARPGLPSILTICLLLSLALASCPRWIDFLADRVVVTLGNFTNFASITESPPQSHLPPLPSPDRSLSGPPDHAHHGHVEVGEEEDGDQKED